MTKAVYTSKNNPAFTVVKENVGRGYECNIHKNGQFVSLASDYSSPTALDDAMEECEICASSSHLCSTAVQRLIALA